MRPAENIEKLIKNINIDTNANSDDAVLGDVIGAFEKSKSQKPSATGQNIWRIIMKSPITKLAAAAVIIVAIMLGMYVMTGSFDGTSITMAQVRQAMEEIDWMQQIAKSKYKEGMDIVWYSFARKVEIVNAKPGISYSDFKARKDLFWPREDKYIYESPIETKQFAYGASGPFEMIDKTLNLVQAEHGKDVVKEIGTYRGQKVEIWTASHVKRGSERTIIVYIDIDRKLPIAATYERVGTKSIYPEETYIEFKYPETGPTDIYQAGVPHDAEVKIIDHGPSPEFLEAVKPYRAARESLPQQRIIVDVENENNNRYRACVVYTDGKKERFEELLWVRDDAPPTTDDFATILDWVNSAKSDELNIQLYDGAVKYRVRRDYRNRWTNSKEYSLRQRPSFVVGGLLHRGWPRLRKGQIVENEYSINNHLLCIETCRSPNIEDNKLLEPAEKTLYYIDPERDYMCVRIEAFSYITPPYGKPEIDDLSFEPSKTPTEPYWVTKVTKFGQTDTGQWYPKEITTNRLSWWLDYPGNTDTPEDEKFVIRLYLDSKPEFPDGIFDPESLPHIGK